MCQSIYMFSLGLKPMVLQMVEELVEDGMDPMDAITEAMTVVVESLKEEVLDA